MESSSADGSRSVFDESRWRRRFDAARYGRRLVRGKTEERRMYTCMRYQGGRVQACGVIQGDLVSAIRRESSFPRVR